MSRSGRLSAGSRGEAGIAGIFSAVTLVIGSIFVGTMAMWTHGWASASSTVGDGAVVVARAAAAETIVAPDGKVGTNCLEAKTRAAEAYRVFRGVNNTRQMLDTSVQDAAELVAVDCSDSFEVEDPKYWACLENTGQRTLDKGPYRVDPEEGQYLCDYSDSYSYYTCPAGETLVGTQCSYVYKVTVYSCPNGGTLNSTTCDRSPTYVYTCPSGGYYDYSRGDCVNPSQVWVCPNGWSKDPNQPSRCYRYVTTTTTMGPYTQAGQCSVIRANLGYPSGWSASYNSSTKKCTYSYTVSGQKEEGQSATLTTRLNPYPATATDTTPDYTATSSQQDKTGYKPATLQTGTTLVTGRPATEQGGTPREYHGTITVLVSERYDGLFGNLDIPITRYGEVSFN